MNFFKKTLLTSALVAAATVASADNTFTAKVGVWAYVADGLSFTVDQELVFGDIVRPKAADVDTPGIHSMTMACETDTLTYNQNTATPNGKPSGTGDFNTAFGKHKSENEADSTVKRGLITIAGEPEYGISITAVSVPSTLAPQGVTFTPRLWANTEAGEGDVLDDVVLPAASQLQVALCGDLTVDSNAIASSIVNLQAAITVNYR